MPDVSRSTRKILFPLCCLWATVALAETPNEVGETKGVPPAAETKPEDDAREAKSNPSPVPGEERGERDAPAPAVDTENTPSPVALRPIGSPPAGPAPEFRGPDVTLIAGEKRTVHEYRHNGQLRMIKVVPKRGKPYYLVPRDPTRGWGDLEQAEALQAEWVLWEF